MDGATKCVFRVCAFHANKNVCTELVFDQTEVDEQTRVVVERTLKNAFILLVSKKPFRRLERLDQRVPVLWRQ